MRDRLQGLIDDLKIKVMAKPSTSIVLTFLSFLAIALLAGQFSLNSPFLWDDLHLIRVHTPEELARVWTGTWDTDHIETPGFRPLTAYFNHVRALAFGESVQAHRIFLLVLFSVYLTMAGLLARWLFATTFWQAMLGGLLVFLHITSVYHYLWISDGVHLLGGALVLGAILCLLKAMSSGKWGWLPAAFLCSVLALLTREDTLTVFPFLLWFGIGYVRMQQDQGSALALSKLPLALFAAAMLMALAAYWYWRSVAVPDALPLKIDPRALIWAATQITQNAGDYRLLINAWAGYAFLIWLWNIWLGGLLTMAVILLKRPQQMQVLFWAGAALIAALPVLMTARANLLLLPVTFWGFLAATVLAEFWRQALTVGWRVCTIGMIVFALAAPAYGSIVFQQEQRLSSLIWVCGHVELTYGDAAGATIPETRREAAREPLNRYGIYSLSDYETEWPKLIREAKNAGRYGVNQQGLPFIPRFDFLPIYPGQWHCAADLK